MARLLLERGADPKAADWYGRTPLWSAVEIRNLDLRSNATDNGVDREAALQLIAALLDKGVDVNARVKEFPPARRHMLPLGSLEWVDFTGQTAFTRAAQSADLEAMRLLIAKGADPRIATFNGTNALMLAAGVNWVIGQTYGSRWLEAVQFCLDLGFDVNAVNQMGLAAVHGAANRGSDDVIELLASRGARLDVPDKEGRTPTAWAEGVFLATNSPIAKPSTIALLGRLDQTMRPLLVSAAFVFALSADRWRGWPRGVGQASPGAGGGRAGAPRRRRIRRSSSRYCAGCHNDRVKAGALVARTAGCGCRGWPRRRVGEGGPQAADRDDASRRRAEAAGAVTRGVQRRARRRRSIAPRPAASIPARRRSIVSIAPSTPTRSAICWRSTWTSRRCCRPTIRPPGSTTSRTCSASRRRSSKATRRPRPRSAGGRSAARRSGSIASPTACPATCRRTRTSTASRWAPAAGW